MEKENRIFDFGETAVPQAGNEEAVITYTLFDSEENFTDKDHPIMVLKASGMPHHITGMFLSPEKRSSFSGEKDGVAYNADILKLDSRFEDFYKWLGENHIPVKLSCRPTDGGFAVYRFRATNLRGEIRNDSDAFLQFAITRLLNSRPPVPSSENEDDDDDTDNDESMILSDLGGMSDFLACAGNVLPAGIRKWAKRNLSLARTGNISNEEKMHARRALSIMLNIKWQGDYFEAIDPVKARQILDEELYGMEKVKQRIIETIIQINRTHTLPAYGILLAGPAGVGKSQLAYAIARILKLPWSSLDMSSIRDAEALTGSPRVYANAKPGLIMEAYMKAGCSNIVFIINELDKADSTKNNSNPADALLTLLDNLGYTDNYIECMIPTGGVYPIATANDKSKISAPLLSRFAVLDIPDYTPEEKKEIFRRFSLPKTLSRMGMKSEEFTLDDEALDAIIEYCSFSTGCRALEQAAEHLAANALYRIETEGVKQVGFTAKEVRQLLGA